MAFRIAKRNTYVLCRELRKSVLTCSSGNKRYNSTTALLSKPKSPKSDYLKGTLTGIGLGIFAGGGYTFYKTQAMRKPPSQHDKIAELICELPAVPISRSISIPNDSTGLNLILFQYPTCPFCCKVRAFLDYYGISYDVVEVNPVLRQQIKWSNYKKVPILLVKVPEGYRQFNDSSAIVSALKTFLKDKEMEIDDVIRYYPSVYYTDHDQKEKMDILNKYFVMLSGNDQYTIKEDELERKWRIWADEVLVHVLSPNVYRTKEEALQAFNWFSEVGEWERLFPNWERKLIVYVGAYAMCIIGKKLKKRHNLKNEVRESLYDECNVWLKELKRRGTKFLGGDKPNLGDLAVYGVLSSIEGCDAFQDLLKNTNISPWFYDVKSRVLNHSGSADILR